MRGRQQQRELGVGMGRTDVLDRHDLAVVLDTSWTATAPDAVRTRRTNRELTRARLPSHPVLSDQIPVPGPENQQVSPSAQATDPGGGTSQA